MKLQNERFLSFKNLPMLLTATFGCVVSFVGLIMVILEIYDGVSCSHGEEMAYCLERDQALLAHNLSWPVIGNSFVNGSYSKA